MKSNKLVTALKHLAEMKSISKSEAVLVEHISGEAVYTIQQLKSQLAEERQEVERLKAELGNFPTGAAVNGAEFLRRLGDNYDFTCEAGQLSRCYEYQEVERCFAAITEYANSLRNQKESE